MKEIEVTLSMLVPEYATDDEIESYLDVELAGWNSMSSDNPLIGEAEVISLSWDD